MAHWRSHGKKIALGRLANDKSVVALSVYCMNHTVQGGGCFHSAELPIAEVLARWPHDWRLDRLPLRCSRCGSTALDVRPLTAPAPQEPFVWKEADKYPERRVMQLIDELAKYLHALKFPPIE
jgi:hypothetical protein